MQNRLNGISAEALILYANTLPDTRLKVIRVIDQLIKGTKQVDIANMYELERQYVNQIKRKYFSE